MTATERTTRFDSPCAVCRRPGCTDHTHATGPYSVTRVDELAVLGFLATLVAAVAVVLVEVAL